MSLLIPARTSQYTMTSEFYFEFDDTVVNADGTTVDFGKATTGADGIQADIINLPTGAVILSGSVVREEAFDTAGYTVEIGDASNDDEYLTATDLKAAGITALVPTGKRSAGPLRLTINNVDACTTGKCAVRVTYMIPGRANEVVPG